MFKHILVPVDGSPTSQLAVDKTIGLARAFGSRVTAIFVLDPYPFTGVGTDFAYGQADYFSAATAEANKAMDEAKAAFKDAGINARSKVAVRRAAPDVYAATIDDRVAMKLGAGGWSPNDQRACDKEWRLSASGQNVAVWTVAA